MRVARIETASYDLVLRLSLWEKLLSFGGDRRLPLRLVRRIEELDGPISAAMDTKAVMPYQRAGVLMPPLVMYGTRLTRTGWDLLAVRGNGRGVLVEFAAGAPFHRLIATVRNPADVVGALRAALPESR
jgi:hypothetical protein